MDRRRIDNNTLNKDAVLCVYLKTERKARNFMWIHRFKVSCHIYVLNEPGITMVVFMLEETVKC